MSIPAIRSGSELPPVKELRAQHKARTLPVSRQIAIFKDAVAAKAIGHVEFLVGATVGLGPHLPIDVLTEALFAAIFRNSVAMASALQNALPPTTPLVIKGTLYALSLVLTGSPINQEALRLQLAERCSVIEAERCSVIEADPVHYLVRTTPQADRQRMLRAACEVSNLVVVRLMVCSVPQGFIENGKAYIIEKRGEKDPVIPILEERLTHLKRESKGASVGRMPFPPGIDGSDPGFGLFAAMDDDHSSRVEHEASLPPPPPGPTALEGIPLHTTSADLPPAKTPPCPSPSSLGDPSMGESSQVSGVIPTPPRHATLSGSQPPVAKANPGDRGVCDTAPIAFAAAQAVWASRPPIIPTATGAPSAPLRAAPPPKRAADVPRSPPTPPSAPPRAAPPPKRTADVPPPSGEGSEEASSVDEAAVAPIRAILSPPDDFEFAELPPDAAKPGWFGSLFSRKKVSSTSK
ncbi:MAG: hypothetical protein JSR76_08415 [Verrucomicrobia bacterium]|nr:hypothetical protein [Verrucomicrobiota bacterium]